MLTISEASEASVTTFSAMIINNDVPLLDGSRITHLHLLSTTRLLVFLMQESKMYVDANAGWTG
jgi:hypothetical protein